LAATLFKPALLSNSMKWQSGHLCETDKIFSDGERGEAICEGQLARGPEDHEANGTDCKTDPYGSAIFRKPGVCFLFLFHMSPSE
jgi:hypothetical protein